MSGPTPEQLKAFNQGIIKEFRENAGKVGGPFEGRRMVLLTTMGARSGKPHTTPLVAGLDGDMLHVIATAGGSHKHPAWYHNAVANPGVQVELGGETFTAVASPAQEPARSELYAAMAAEMPQFAEYAEGNPRTIPVLLLAR